MKNLVCTALIAIGIGIGMSACVTEDPTEDAIDEIDPASLSEEQQAIEVCREAYGCVLTSIRDNGGMLIDTCIAVLCP